MQARRSLRRTRIVLYAHQLAVLALAAACGGSTADPRSTHVVVREVELTTDDSVRLAGEFAFPANVGESKVAAVVLVGGSGAQDRNGSRLELTGYQPLADIAEAITAEGIAVLRLDDRGAGKSTGTATGTTTTRSAIDVGVAIRWLRAQPEVDGDRIGIVGHSEGGLIAMLAASSDTAIRTLVLLATPSRPGREVARWQREWMASSDVARFPPSTRRRTLDEAERAAEEQARTDAWMREWFALDPRDVARTLRGRALVIHGAQDRQVPVEQADELARALREAGVTVEVMRSAGIDHLLLHDTDGDPRSYVRIVDRRVAREILERIAVWLSQRS